MINRYLTVVAVAFALVFAPVTFVAVADNGDNKPPSNTEKATGEDIIQTGDPFVKVVHNGYTYLCKPSILNSDGELKYNVPIIGLQHFCDKVDLAPQPPATKPLNPTPAPISHTG